MRKFIAAILIAMMLLPATGAFAAREAMYLDGAPDTLFEDIWFNIGGIYKCGVFESLLLASPDLSTVSPALATEYNVSEDGKVFTFTLREGVAWHDGEAFDAEDVVFSIKTVLRAGIVNAMFTTAFGYIEGAAEYVALTSDELPGVTAEGNVVTVKTTQPVGNFIDVIGQFGILPEHLLKDADPLTINTNEFWAKPVGLGCYKVTEVEFGNYVVLEANEAYYGAQPGIPKIILSSIDNGVLAAEAGQLDFYNTNDPEQIAQLNALPNYSGHPVDILFPAYLIMRLESEEGVNEKLADVRVRKALVLAIDREAIVEAIYPGSSTTDTLVPSGAAWYLDDAESLAYDPAAAKALLEEAGFDFSQTVKLRYYTGGQATKDLLDSIAFYWGEVGINVDLQKFEGDATTQIYNVRDYDLTYKRLSAFDYAGIYQEVLGANVMQTALLNQPVYDELIDKLTLETDPAAREEIVKDMQKLDQEHLLRLPLFSLANIIYVNDEHIVTGGNYGNVWFRYDFNFPAWELK